MPQTDHCAYPPQIAADVEVTEQMDGERLAYVIGSAAAGRYILLRATEYQVLQLLGASLAPGRVCDEFKRRHGGTLPLATLTKFLAKLDQVGILAGERAQGAAAGDRPASQQHYLRFKLFDPDPLFTRLVPPLRWVWTPGFFIFTVLLMLSVLLLSLLNWAEVTSYGDYVLREHYLAVFLAGLVVVVSHEFAHGLTCKAFGGRATEVGVLMVFYFLPALYCNVSGIHLIPQRGRRLWVIAAGVYWQLLVGTFALLMWLLLAPHTLASDLAFIFFFGSVLNLVFNANPLIKLDGYYFLSQWLRLPNLMDRSHAYWRGLWRRVVSGERDEAAARYHWRERLIYAGFGLLSTLYAAALAFVIVRYIGEYLVNSFYLLGLLITAGIGCFYLRRPLGRLASGVSAMTAQTFSFVLAGPAGRPLSLPVTRPENPVTEGRQEPLSVTKGTGQAGGEKTTSRRETPGRGWRRRLVPSTVLLLIILALLMPWEASVGSYGTLVAIPGREAIIRAPESATLIELRAQPGEVVAGGALVGRLGNLELEEQIVRMQSELMRANADYERLLGELRTRGESAARARAQLSQREHDYEQIDSERRQIDERRRAESAGAGTDASAASPSPTPPPHPSRQPDRDANPYPAAVAVLQADVDLRRARLEEANTQLDRARQLYAQGVMPRSELDAAETRSSTLAIELAGARERLEAALIDHRRKHMSTATDMNVARSDVGAERLQAEKLKGELRAMRDLIGSLEGHSTLLRRKQAQFELLTPRAGTVFGEELPRMVGQYFQKGAEICRVADTSQLLLRIRVPEREIGDVRVGYPVRLKARSFPDRVFRGRVSKIGGESEFDEFHQATYRVELTIDNGDGLLRPGMTAFARIDFGRRMIVRIMLHKIKQALRPELWMF